MKFLLVAYSSSIADISATGQDEIVRYISLTVSFHGDNKVLSCRIVLEKTDEQMLQSRVRSELGK